MYEMEGPLLVIAALVAGCPAAVRHATATVRVPRRLISGDPVIVRLPDLPPGGARLQW
jgi:hypothetical protein